MTKKTIFDIKYIDFFGYDDETVEFLFNILKILNYDDRKPVPNEARKETLFVIEELLSLDLIFIFHWGEKHDEMKNKSLNIKETIKYIDSIWLKEAIYPDYYGMVMIGYQDWYIQLLIELGYKPLRTEWRIFVKNKIGNLEKWIEENRP